MKKKYPKYLKLVVDNGKLIDHAYELALEQQSLIKEKLKIQLQVKDLVTKDHKLGSKINELENEINQLERKVNGTIERETGRNKD